MKQWTTAIILCTLLIAFIVFGAWSDRAVLKATGQLDELTKELQTAVNNEDWQSANLQLGKLSAKWPEIRRNWDFRMNRDEMDDLDTGLARMQGFVNEEDKAGALSELNVWRTLVNHIRQKEVFRFRNLL